jgi:hypothetical protein
METWKKVVGAPKYEVSDHGRVRKGTRMKPLNKKIYLRTRINGKYRRVHTLVLPAFKPNPAPWLYNCVDHIDQVKHNNKLENLRWSNSTLNSLNRKNVQGYNFKPHEKHKKYYAQIWIDRKCICLGSFATAAEATARYKEAVKDAFEILEY